jgi:hypothetical protein
MVKMIVKTMAPNLRAIVKTMAPNLRATTQGIDGTQNNIETGLWEVMLGEIHDKRHK